VQNDARGEHAGAETRRLVAPSLHLQSPSRPQPLLTTWSRQHAHLHDAHIYHGIMATITYPPSPTASATPPHDSSFGPKLKEANGTQSPETCSHDSSPTYREHLAATYNRRTIPLMPEEDFYEVCDATALEIGTTADSVFRAALAERVRQRTSDIERQLEESKLCMLDPNTSEEDDQLFMLIQQETSLGRSQFIAQTLHARASASSAANTTHRSKSGISKPRHRRRTQPSSSSATDTPRRSGRIRNMKNTKKVGT
jgi:hypothetical protein